MSISSHSRLLTLAAAGTMSLALVTVAPPSASAQSTISFGDIQRSGITLLVGGQYAWVVQVNQPQPARMFGVPSALSDALGAQQLDVTFDWGDGTTSLLTSMTEPSPLIDGSIWCRSDYTQDDTTDPPTYTPGDNFGYECAAGAGHTYTSQGIYTVRVSASQPTDEGLATGDATPMTDQVVDLALGGSVTGKGTVTAPAGSGGMYDTNYGGGTVSFQMTAKRRAGTTATTANVTVSAPNMTPDYPFGDPLPQGMTFHGVAAMAPLYIDKTRTGGEVYLSRVEGTVTNSRGSAGGAWASVHVIVNKGSTTLIRIMVWNTSAGYTYLDTGWQSTDLFTLDPTHDLLVSGSVKVG